MSNGNIDKLLRNLQSINPAIREKAADQLARLQISNERVIQALESVALSDESNYVRGTAKEALGRLSREKPISEFAKSDATNLEQIVTPHTVNEETPSNEHNSHKADLQSKRTMIVLGGLGFLAVLGIALFLLRPDLFREAQEVVGVILFGVSWLIGGLIVLWLALWLLMGLFEWSIFHMDRVIIILLLVGIGFIGITMSDQLTDIKSSLVRIPNPEGSLSGSIFWRETSGENIPLTGVKVKLWTETYKAGATVNTLVAYGMSESTGSYEVLGLDSDTYSKVTAYDAVPDDEGNIVEKCWVVEEVLIYDRPQTLIFDFDNALSSEQISEHPDECN